MELFSAHKQWANRPADQRFTSLQEVLDVTQKYAAISGEKRINVREIRAEARDGELMLVGKNNTPAQLTHWSFGQLCSRVGAPANYLRELPATLAAQNINHGLANLADDYASKMLFHANGKLLLRAITGEDYARIWNWEVAERLMWFEANGWKPATADTGYETCLMCGGSGGQYHGEGNDCRHCKGTGKTMPALYASDHDMFVFMCSDNAVVKELGNEDGLKRGFICSNSEVGAASLILQRFLYRRMCGNHIIWGAKKVVEINVRHVGSARNRWGAYAMEIRKYAEESASDDEQKIARAKTVHIADTKEKVLDKLFGMRSLTLSRKALTGGYDAVVPDQDGDPTTVWGIVQGLTRYSQTSPHADDRTAIDKAAGKIMDIDF